jgi:uncharacterized BrkB/YihY/UPF0761 family membrane protein
MLALLAEAVDITTETTDAANNAVAGGVLAAFGGFLFVLVIIGVLFFIFWLVMLLNALKLDEETFRKIGSGEKTLWLVILGVSLFVGLAWLAALIYYFVIYRKAKTVAAPAAPAAPNEEK